LIDFSGGPVATVESMGIRKEMNHNRVAAGARHHHAGAWIDDSGQVRVLCGTCREDTRWPATRGELSSLFSSFHW